MLTVRDARLDDAGNYLLSFSNSIVDVSTGTVTNLSSLTASATVFVLDEPVIQSVSTVTHGAGVAFTVAATGGLLAYQWIWQGQEIPGATSSVLNFNDAYANANAGYYQVRVSNPVDTNGVTSSPSGLLFTKPTPAGVYQGIFYATNTVTTETCGSFQFTISASQRSFSGKLIIGLVSYRFSGTFDPAHHVQVTVPGPVSGPLEVDMQLLTTNDTPAVVGIIGNETWTGTLRGIRLYYSNKTPTRLAGKYTLSLVNTNTLPELPNGHGYASLTVRSNGTVVVSGQVADGTAFSQTAGLSRTGEWPLYATLNRGRGRVLGWMLLRQGAPSIIGTNIFWIKDPGPDKLYPEGISLPLTAVGSFYTAPVKNRVLNFTNGVAALYGGDLISDQQAAWDFVRVTLKAPATFVAEDGAEGLRVSADKGTGVVSGSFVDIMTGLRAPIRGVVLQQQNIVQGFFLSTNRAGAFSIAPGTPPH